MKFFIDSADISEIREAAALGVLDGVTTNPSLVSKTGKPFRQVLDEILEVVDGPISAEVTAVDFDGMIKEAAELAAIHDNIVVKIPIIHEGLKAIKHCAQNGIRTNCTLCFNPLQALMAAKAGASYISPFVGRLDDISHDGMELIQQVRTIYDNYGYDTEVLVASIRHPQHVVQAALMGADVATMPFSVVKKLLQHPLTDIGLEKFLADWKKLQESVSSK
ncbi:MAG: fructose-6-phosphate aldolase [Acidobacteriota bacterium]|nr:MAG: fructose-6-phosphate aldolase [Acidobacteriota bacterium]